MSPHCKQSKSLSFFVGQSISLCIACTSIFTQLLANKNVYLAFTQSFGNYLLLSFFMIIRLCQRRTQLKTAWWKYCIVGFIDAEANCLIVKAYEYTNILSIMLCDAMCIPTCVVITLLVFHSKYSWKHYLAVLLCLLGLTVMIVSDYKKGQEGGTHQVWGDLMALGGSVLYAVSNSCQEALVKHNDWKEFLGMIGVSGSVTTLTQLLLFERTALQTTNWDTSVVLLLLGFVLALMLMYVLTATFLQWNDAVVFNMHLLTSDVIAAVLSFFLFKNLPTLTYFIALAITIVGVVLYNVNPPINDLSKPSLPEEQGKVKVKMEATKSSIEMV